MKVAILDLGTNTFHLLIADVKGTKFKILFKTKIAVKLGEGAIHRHRIAREPFRRGIETLLHYKTIIDENKPDKIFAFATSAIRSAKNGDRFIKEAKRKTGISVRVISGAKEAELIYLGVRQCIRLVSPALIMDIGGGSTEFIIADEKKIYWKKSFNIGAARLLELFRPSDPITGDEIRNLEMYLEQQLSPVSKALNKLPVKKLIGSSGSFDTFAEMAGYRYHNQDVLLGKKKYKFNMDEFYDLYLFVLGSTNEQRLEMKGLIKMRVDMIVIAGICTNYILKRFNLKEMHLSKYALKEGALWQVINR